MQRVLVVGSGGSGKSTLAREVGARMGLPVVHLDQHFGRAGWVEIPRDEWAEVVRALVAEERWVMDGNYSGRIDVRLARAEAVVLGVDDGVDSISTTRHLDQEFDTFVWHSGIRVERSLGS